MAEATQERRRLKAKVNSHPNENNNFDQNIILTQENEKLKTENADQKEQIEKLQENLSLKDKILSRSFFTVIDTQLRNMKESNRGSVRS